MQLRKNHPLEGEKDRWKFNIEGEREREREVQVQNLTVRGSEIISSSHPSHSV